jgi:hypothetical protein
MKRLLLIVLPLLLILGCEDKEDDSFSIVGKWQKASKIESTGEWQCGGDIYDLKEGESGIYYDEGDLEDPQAISWSYDESIMLLKITRSSNEVFEYFITIESNDIIFWGEQAMKRI